MKLLNDVGEGFNAGISELAQAKQLDARDYIEQSLAQCELVSCLLFIDRIFFQYE